MADSIKIQTAISYYRETPAEIIKLLDQSTSQIPDSYEKGEVNIPANTVDLEIATGVNIFTVFTNGVSSVSVKIGDTTATAMTSLKSFSYNGASTKVFVSNPNATEAVKIYFVSAKVS